MITNNINTPKVLGVRQTQINKHQQIKSHQNIDKVSFTGISSLTKTQNIDEIKELVKLLHDSNIDSRLRRNPNFKPNWFTTIYDKVNLAISKFLRATSAPDEDTIIAITKKGNKIVGGYTMFLDPSKSTAYIDFITLSPELKNTKTGKDILIEIGKNIYKQLENTNITEIAWLKDKNYTKLFEKLNPKYTNLNTLMPDEYIMFVNEFGKSINDLSIKYHFQGK